MAQASDLHRLLSSLKAGEFNYREFSDAEEVSGAVASWPLLHDVARATGQPVAGSAPEGDAAAKERIARNQTMMPVPPAPGTQLDHEALMAVGENTALGTNKLGGELPGMTLRQRLAASRSGKGLPADPGAAPATSSERPIRTIAAAKALAGLPLSRIAVEEVQKETRVVFGELAINDPAEAGRGAQRALDLSRQPIAEAGRVGRMEPLDASLSERSQNLTSDNNPNGFLHAPFRSQPVIVRNTATFLGGAYRPSVPPTDNAVAEANGKDREDRSLRAVFARLSGNRGGQGRRAGGGLFDRLR